MTNRTEDQHLELLSLANLLTILLRGRRTIILASTMALAIAVVITLLSPRLYKSSVAFVSQDGGGALEGLSGLASQFGFRVPSMNEGLGPEFYRDLLTEREIVGRVVERSYITSEGASPIALVDLLEIREPSEEARLLEAREWLREEALQVSLRRETGVVAYSVTTRWPRVSLDVAQGLLAAVQEFNAESRRTQAKAEREFLQGRLDSARTALESAEEDLERFLLVNRSYQSSADLTLRFERLQRQVAIRQELYQVVVRAFEQARMQEVRTTPVLTLIEAPRLAPRREPRGLVMRGLLFAMVGVGCGVSLVLLRAYFAEGAMVEGHSGLHAEWEATRRELLGLFRRRT